MKKLYFLVFAGLLLTFSVSVSAQKSVTDSSIFIPSVAFTYGHHFPGGGNIANTFGNHNTIGADFTFKLRNQLIFGLNFEYIFGENVRNKESYFKEIVTEKGFIIDGDGRYAEVHLYERGINLQAFTGYQFSFWSPNPNSGPFIQLGVGFLQYYVEINNPELTAPQIKDDYKKMYDRLCNGLSTSQLIGYRYMGNRNLANFYAGIEFTQAWTENRRTYNADLTPEDLGEQFDWSVGIKVGWMIPFYKRAPQDFYYF